MNLDFPEPRLEHLYDIHVDLETPLMLGQTPIGNRLVFPLKAGTFEGPRLRGEVVPGGGDWAIIRADGVLQLDVRAMLKTDDSELIYVTYSGLIVADPPVFNRLLAGEDVSLNEYEFFINPMFQTGSEKYAWLNKVVAVGRGRSMSGGVEYRVWAARRPG